MKRGYKGANDIENAKNVNIKKKAIAKSIKIGVRFAIAYVVGRTSITINTNLITEIGKQLNIENERYVLAHTKKRPNGLFLWLGLFQVKVLYTIDYHHCILFVK